MKINLYVVSLLFAINFASGQNVEEQKKIISTYDLSKVKDLSLRLEQKEKERQLKIDNYLSANTIAKRPISPDGKKYKIVDIIDGKPIYITTDNASAAKAIKTNRLYPGGSLGLNLEGANMTIGIWDGGWVRASHIEFHTSSSSTVSRVTNPDAGILNPPSDGHGTHVAGTIGSRGSVASSKGMAPKSTILSYNWDNDSGEVVTEASTHALLLSNHSYGTPIYTDSGEMAVPNWYMGCYTDATAEWDELCYTLPYYLMVASAGNSGNDAYSGGLSPGYDKLTGNKAGKNNLVIANANPTIHPITGNITSLVINPSSSQGPTDDGRIKPDIAADGTNLYSTWNSADNAYETLTGTSMASPSVAGTLLLLQQHYNNLNAHFMKSATLKGLVCHTALDDPDAVGPDPKFGWGMLDAEAAAQAITKNSNGQALILESELNAANPTYTMSFTVTNPTNLKATICWLDPVGTVRNGSLNNPAPSLVNDLDLRVSSAETTYFPWKLQLSNVTAPAIKGDNVVDNVESVSVDASSGSNFTLTITHKGALTTGSQPFSLILTGTGVSLGTKENALNPISIWPNPTTDRLYYKLSNGASADAIRVYDLSGKLMNLRVSNDFVDVSGLQQGVYILKLETDSSSNVYKFVKK